MAGCMLAKVCCLAAEPADSSPTVPKRPPLELFAGPVTLSIAADIGGRLASAKWRDFEMLQTDRDPNGWHWGSTAWTSPQSDWQWPPIATFDSEPFRIVSNDSESIELESRVDHPTGLQMRKRFRNLASDPRRPTFEIRYELTNRSDTVQTVGLWENTRVDHEGEVDVDASLAMRLNNEDFPPVATIHGGTRTFVLDGEQPQGQKVFLDSADFDQPISLRYRRGGVTLTKSMTLSSPVSENQSPIEIYLAPEDGFSELELQGESAELAPGESVAMTVLWTFSAD